MDEQQSARLEQVLEAQIGNQVMQIAKQAVEIESLKAQLAQAYADLASAKPQIVNE